MANQLKTIREQQGISRHALARRLQIAPSTLWRWEQEATAPAYRDMLKIARHLNVAATDLFPELSIQQLNTTHGEALQSAEARLEKPGGTEREEETSDV